MVRRPTQAAMKMSYREDGAGASERHECQWYPGSSRERPRSRPPAHCCREHAGQIEAAIMRSWSKPARS